MGGRSYVLDVLQRRYGGMEMSMLQRRQLSEDGNGIAILQQVHSIIP